MHPSWQPPLESVFILCYDSITSSASLQLFCCKLPLKAPEEEGEEMLKRAAVISELNEILTLKEEQRMELEGFSQWTFFFFIL